VTPGADDAKDQADGSAGAVLHAVSAFEKAARVTLASRAAVLLHTCRARQGASAVPVQHGLQR
jgi:hypothetical protein